MKKKLYRVKVVLFVMAENESGACAAATQAHFDIFECTARKAADVDPGWLDAIPYNSDDERTCAEIVSNDQYATRPDASSVKLPSYVETGIRDFDFENRSIQP